MRQVSYDLTLQRSAASWPTARRITALEMQWELLAAARKYADEHGLEPWVAEVGEPWCSTSGSSAHRLETDPMQLADRLDWVAKRRMVDGYRSATTSTGTTPGSPPWTCSTTTCGRAKSLAADGSACDASSDDAEVEAAMTEPPDDTRAYFRGRCLQRWADDIVAANWDSLVFDTGATRCAGADDGTDCAGTAAHVG
jgi:hypothetical protein